MLKTCSSGLACLALAIMVSLFGISPALAAATAGSATKTAPVPFPVATDNETVFKLSNGLTVCLIKDGRFPMVCTRLYVRTGSSHESPGQYGISHVLEHMVFKGTTNRPAGAIAREVERLGGYLNAYTSFDRTCYLTDMPARHWKTGIDIVRDMAFNPLLDPTELEREKPVIISELEGYEDQPLRRLMQESQRATLAGTPYEVPIIGTREDIMAVTTESLRAYIKRWYHPQNMLLVVAGDIDQAAVREFVEESFGSLVNTGDIEQEEPVDINSVTETPRVRVLRGPWKKVYLSLSVPAPAVSDFESLRLDLLSYLLAGDGTSLLERRYRYDLNLVDSIEVSNRSMSRLGMLTVGAVLDVEKLDEFFVTLVRDLRDLKMSSFTSADLERAKFTALDSMDRMSETLNGLTSWRAAMQFDQGGRQGEANIRTYLNDVSLDAIAEAWARYMVPERVRVRVLAPVDRSTADLAGILEREWPVPDKKADKAVSKKADEETLTLSNGVKLILIPDATMPYLSMTMAATGGNALLKPSEAGLATLAASLLTDGCGDMDRVEFERRQAARAIAISASANGQSFAVKATGPTRYSGEMLELVSVMMDSPRFDKQELTKEVQDMNSRRTMRDENPLAHLNSRLWPALFGSHPYGLDPLGTARTLAACDRSKVSAFWKKQRSMPWVLAVAGSFDRAQIVEWASRLPAATEQAVYPEAPAWGKNKSLTMRMPDRNKAHYMRIYPAVARSHPDAPALMVLSSVLSGQSGLLFSQLRDRDSLGYTVMSQNKFYPTTGLSLLYAGTTPERVDDARKGFDAIVGSLKETELEPGLLEEACNSLEGDYIRSRQSLSSRAAEAAAEMLLNQPRHMARDLIEKARNVTPADVRRVVQTYYHDGYEFMLVPQAEKKQK